MHAYSLGRYFMNPVDSSFLVFAYCSLVILGDPNTMGDASERGEVITDTGAGNLNYEVRAKGVGLNYI